MYQYNPNALLKDEADAQAQLIGAIEAGDRVAAAKLYANGYGWGFQEYDPICVLSYVCSSAQLRNQGWVPFLLDLGHPVDGMHYRNDGHSPLGSLLRDKENEDTATFDLLLSKGSTVDRLVPYNPFAADDFADWPLWVLLFQAGKASYIKSLLNSGWEPNAWRDWTPSQSDPKTPLHALDGFVKYGHHCAAALKASPLARAELANDWLDLLIAHGFDVDAPDIDPPQSEWWRMWQRSKIESVQAHTTPAPRLRV